MGLALSPMAESLPRVVYVHSLNNCFILLTHSHGSCSPFAPYSKVCSLAMRIASGMGRGRVQAYKHIGKDACRDMLCSATGLLSRHVAPLTHSGPLQFSLDSCKTLYCVPQSSPGSIASFHLCCILRTSPGISL